MFIRKVPGAGVLAPPRERGSGSMKEEVVGSVVVVGGGIAGIQASLDLANSGYFVHLVEK